MSEPQIIDTPFGPQRVWVVGDMPDPNSIIIYSAPAPGTSPEDPDWMPLERRCAKIVLD